MPVKREQTPDSTSENDLKPLVNGTTKKVRKTPPSTARKERNSWSEVEESHFKEAINNIVKKNIWSEIKMNFPELAGNRSADACINH
ncbi:hypothetical protein L486_00268 [Kwoniella mangroviensis CBS 10435]|uniref:Myb-like domain-containing protein n=1 Tax=Kwoniella mangroviensis CBS 10435 TaxID=1331196 RepID=A0A1B9IYP9_9TREE|nr:uncharacterized protein I203_06412 [Kwoniella mangroviensis CBS 8507]OCF60632.1 hypothetical protein L486_00268 [Kwoniella mangroviensis CBS 10435]OCF64677.1 hypothetical protein I203_06412 [Kwoniella mangroviensis CBS 8507]OCF74619.1 hypothetical protein I204_04998 [Kwoniella mangroviensis CBS 8886]